MQGKERERERGWESWFESKQRKKEPLLLLHQEVRHHVFPSF